MVSDGSVCSTSPWASPMLGTISVDEEAKEPVVGSMGDSTGEFEEARAADVDVLQVGSFKELRGKDEGGSQWYLGGIDDVLLPPPLADFGDSDVDYAVLGKVARVPASLPTSAVAAAERLTQEPAASWNRAVLLLFPLQLGFEKHVGEAHIPAMLRYFELPSSLGAMGGRPRMAHFFVGRRGRDLLYVDPHVVQPAAVDSNSDEDASEGHESFLNTPTVQTIPAEHIDSSISFAFYCQSDADLRELVVGIRRLEAAEAEAPIRTERTRPAALRPRHVVAGDCISSVSAAAWCDVEGCSSFTEVQVGDAGTACALSSEAAMSGAACDCNSLTSVSGRVADSPVTKNCVAAMASSQRTTTSDDSELAFAWAAVAAETSAECGDAHGAEEEEERWATLAELVCSTQSSRAHAQGLMASAIASGGFGEGSGGGSDQDVSVDGDAAVQLVQVPRSISVCQPWSMIEASSATA
eukprot:TRINITY_DN45089_c0_g1_i1.p1 TRINITY_DN45089_c0_g1~~TRINITY_DN45089_c0_g1_i1.p1  ORF type:complete len:487 (+),score=107.95 TRINITY_DN45089_c0_g1_i1:62-1462(+)